MSLKRSRADLDDSDDDISFGRQLLPVANLPASFDGVPNDGLEYLFTVRRDAKRLPHVTRVENPYEKAEQRVLPSTPVLSSSHPCLPSQVWRNLFRQRFYNLRKNVIQPTSNVQLPRIHQSTLMPDKKERDSWWAFLSGKPESDWNPLKKTQLKHGIHAFHDEPMPTVPYQVPMTDHARPTSEPDEAQSLAPRRLTPLLLQHIDQRMSLHLIMYFTYWINLSFSQQDPPFPRINDVHAQWIFFLLTRIDDYISADDMSQLRNLARACLKLVRVMLREEKGQEGELTKESCWIIITTVIGVWGQQDLWTDAETMLNAES